MNVLQGCFIATGHSGFPKDVEIACKIVESLLDSGCLKIINRSEDPRYDGLIVQWELDTRDEVTRAIAKEIGE